jgi:hypothetical protein
MPVHVQVRAHTPHKMAMVLENACYSITPRMGLLKHASPALQGCVWLTQLTCGKLICRTTFVPHLVRCNTHAMGTMGQGSTLVQTLSTLGDSDNTCHTTRVQSFSPRLQVWGVWSQASLGARLTGVSALPYQPRWVARCGRVSQPKLLKF